MSDKGNPIWNKAIAIGKDGKEKELTGKYLKPNAKVVLEPQTNKPEVLLSGMKKAQYYSSKSPSVI